MDFNFKGRPLNTEESEILIKILLVGSLDKPLDQEERLKDDFLAQIVIKRLKAFKLPFMISSAFYVISLSTVFNNPGKIVMLLWLAYKYHLEKKIAYLDINAWVDMFPMTIPTEEELQYMWESQKSPGAPLGNLLDDPNTWHPSLHFTPLTDV